jgi:hypothetical protein
MNKKFKRNSIKITMFIIIIIIIFFTISFSIIPANSNFELTYSNFKKEINLGEELEITAEIWNKNFLIHKIIYSSDILFIYIKKADDTSPAVFTSESILDLFFMLEKKKETVPLIPQEKGDYKVFIVSKFSIRGKQYYYESIIDVKVV